MSQSSEHMKIAGDVQKRKVGGNGGVNVDKTEKIS